MQKQVISGSLDDFYYLARLTLVKDEAHFDKFDRASACTSRASTRPSTSRPACRWTGWCSA
jgi:uncharacterized protein with von Willebrand factor type A (vWA) domain